MMDSAIRDQIFFKSDEENMTALKAAAWQTINHDEQNKGESTIGDLRIAPSINPHDLHLEDMSEEQIKEARKYGGWDPDKHKYVHFNQDGDLEGLTEKQADKLIWDNRQRILQAATTSPRTSAPSTCCITVSTVNGRCVNTTIGPRTTTDRKKWQEIWQTPSMIWNANSTRTRPTPIRTRRPRT